MNKKIIIGILIMLSIMNSVNAVSYQINITELLNDTSVSLQNPDTSYYNQVWNRLVEGNTPTETAGRSYYYWDISLFSGYGTDSANMTLAFRTDYENTHIVNMTVYYFLDEDWTGLTWNTQPDWNHSLINTTYMGSGSAYRPTTFDITSGLNEALMAGKTILPIMLKFDNEGVVRNIVYKPSISAEIDSNSDINIKASLNIINYKFNGTVKNGITLNNLSGAFVSLSKTGYYDDDMTETNGYFEFLNLGSGGVYDLDIMKSGYSIIDESITISSDTNKTYYLYPVGYEENLSTSVISFIINDSRPFINEEITFEYFDGCPDLEGNIYYWNTNSDGKITYKIPKGNYHMIKEGYMFRESGNDYYSESIDLSIYPDNFQKTIYVKKENITYDIKITVLDDQIYTAINNTYVSLTSLENFYSGYTNENGELNLTVQNGNYEVVLEHSNYIMDYSQLIYDFEFLTQSEWVFSITPKTSLFSSISGNIYDADTGSVVNATDIHLHTINRHDIIQNSNTYSFQNITNPIPSESLDISLFVEASGYMPYHWEYPDFPIGINLTHNIYLVNASSYRVINATFTHSYDLPNVFIRLSSLDEYHWVYLNSSNSIEVYNLSKNTIYNFYAWTGDEYNYLYKEIYDIIQVNETNFSYVFTLEKQIPKAIFNGYVYTSNDFGISGVHIELISGNQKYTFTTNSDGYFYQAINADLEYTLNISKDGYIPNPLVVYNITVPLESEEGNIYHLYSEEELNIFYAHIKSNETLHIGGANVILTKQSNNEVFYFESDDSGIAICEIPEGIYSIRILKDGYKEYNEKDIIISNSQSKYYTIEKIPIGDFTFTEKDFFNLLFEFGWLILAIVIGLFVLALIIMLLREIRG